MAGPWDVVDEAPLQPSIPAPAAGGWDVVEEAPVAGSPVTQAIAPPRPIPLDPASQPGLGDRFMLNAREAFQDTVAGEVRNRVRSGQLASDTASDMARALREAIASGSPVGLDSFGDGRPNPYAAVPLQQLQEMQTQTAQEAERRNAEYTQLRGEQRREFAQLPSFTEAPSLWGKAVQGAVSLAGSVAGSLPTPENLIAAPVARGGAAARAAGESLPKYFGRMAAPGAAEGMAANVPANVAVQTGQVERGERPEFSGTELGEAVVLGAGIGASFRMVGPLYRELRASIARRKGVAQDSINPDSIGPQEIVDAINEDPVFAEAARANGIEGPDDKRFAVLQDRLAKRRIEESLRPAPDNYGADGRPVTSDDWRHTPKAKGVFSEEVQRRQDELANLGQANQETTTQNGVTAQTARATEEGTINPQAANVVPREPDTRPIAVQPDGGAYRADDATMQGRNREQVTREARTLRLPAPGREVLTDAEIARMRPAPEAPPVETPPKLYGSEDRAPQTSTDMVGQRQAGDAFTLAERQRGRAGADVRDTQVAGRPQGIDDNQDVMIDKGTGYVVRFKNLGDGGRIWVEAYDPRSGNPLDGVPPFQVSTTALQRRSYAVDPRRAQDFKDRAGTPEGERMGLPQQTYRTTAPDAQNGAGGPASNVKPSLRPREGSDRLEPGLTQTGRRSTRNALPEQAAGEAPAPKPRGGFGNYEEAMRDFAERQQRGQTEPPKSGPDYSKAKSSNQARTPDSDGRFVVDENGYVMSSAEGPIKFADQKQAAKWILNVGQKQSPDQIFEIAVHPTGKGFTARERGRSETPPPGGGKARPETAAKPETNRPAQPETPRGLKGPQGRSVRQLKADEARMKQEQAKRTALLGDDAALRAYATDKGISTDEMRALLRTNFDNAAPELERLSQYLASDEGVARGEIEVQRASNIKFEPLAVEPPPRPAPEPSFDDKVRGGLEGPRAEQASEGITPEQAERRRQTQERVKQAPVQPGDRVRTEDGDYFDVTEVIPHKDGTYTYVVKWDNGKVGSINHEGMTGLLEGQRYIDSNTGERKQGAPARIERATDQPDTTPTSEPSFDDKVRAERDRLWAEDMGRAKRSKSSNDRMVEATARENVMRQEVGPEVIREAEATGAASRDDITDIAQLYRRKEGQSSQEAWEDAYASWVDKNEGEAMRDANIYTQEDLEFDPLKVDSNSEAAKIADVYTQEAQGIEREARISRESLDNIPFDEVPNGKREADRPADAAGRQDAQEQSAERGGTRQEAGGGREGARDYATDAGPDGGRQTVVPGAERDTRGANQRRADAPLRGGDEAPPRGGLFDEDARNQATFFSNPFLDPAAWKGLGKMLGLHSGYVRHMRAMFNDIKDMRDGGSSKKTWTMTDIGRSIMWSNDGQLGALEKAYNSPTIGALRDWLHPEADMGRQGTSPKRGYHEATDIRTQGNLNKLSDVLEPFMDNKSAKDQIVRLVQNPGNIKRGTPIHDAAVKIRSMLDDELQYLKAAGVDISEIKSGGYWPRIIDAFRVLQNPEKFLRAASRQYLKDGLAPNRTEADAMALAWLESIEMGGVGMRKEGTDFVMLGGTPNADFKRERVFGQSIEREANNPLREFYVQDPSDVLTLHFQRTARRAEWAREMGDDLSKWKKKKDAIVKEGGIAALPQVVDLIANATGISKSYISPHARSAVSVIRSLGVFGTLSLAAASSIAETAMPAIRAGNPARLVGDVGRTIKALAGKMDNERAWAEDLGVIVNALGDSILGRRYHALEAGNKFQQRIMNRYFRMTGLEQLTTAQRVVAVAGAQAYLRRQAINLTNGGKRTKSAQDFLSELGIDGKNAEGFSKWLLQQADGKPTSASVKDDGAYGTMYRTAMHRFIRQTNMDPNTSTRPAWANDPYKSLMFQLNSYTWAFQKNVLNRAGAGIVKGLTGKGYTMQDRMAFLAPAMMLPVLYAIQSGVGEVRDNVFADPTAKPKDDTEKVMRNLDRAGAFGQASPLMNFITGVRYERDLASSFAGPALGNLLRPIETAIKATGDRNSPNTNTRERALAKDIYRGFVFPVVAGAMVAAAPMGAGALAIQALNTGEAREAATSAVAGPKPVERPQRPKPPQRPQPPRPPRP